MDQGVLTELRELEERLWRSQTRFDRAAMDKLLAPDFFEFGRSGRVYSRDQVMPELDMASEIDVILPLSGFQARHLAPDLVQVTYVSEEKAGAGLHRANRCSIWSRKGERWVLRFHQGTAVPESA